MHYRNGRRAEVGQPVIGRTYNQPGTIVGTLISITPGSDTCNCKVAFVGDAAEPVKVDYSQCDHLLHADDAYEAADPLTMAALKQSKS